MSLKDQVEKSGQPGPGTATAEKPGPELTPQQKMAANVQREMQRRANSEGAGESDAAVAKAKAGMGADPKTREAEEMDEMSKFTEEDYRLAEECIFKGYARKEEKFGRGDKHKFEICTLVSYEIKLVNELVFEEAKDKEMSQHMIQDRLDAFFLGAGLLSIDDKAFPEDPRLSIALYKNGISQLRALEQSGKVEEFDKQYKAVKDLLSNRATAAYGLGNALRTVISQKRAEFEQKMLDIMKGDLLKNF